MAVTVLHTGDLHLGSPLQALSGASADIGERLARATQESFRRIVTVALDRAVDAVVVAGDLYDRESRSVRANEFLRDQLERLALADIPCFVVHGNHDPLGEGGEHLDLPENTYVFPAAEVESVAVPDAEDPAARAIGQSYGARHVSNKLSYHYSAPDASVPTIGVLHTGLDPDGRRYAPCGPADLASKDVDYWALGHRHDTGLIQGAPAAYCGIPQGRHVREAGLGGCLLVELTVGADPDIEFIPTSPIVWRRVTIDVEAAESRHDSALRNLTDLEGYLADRALEIQDLDATAFVEHDVPIADHDWEPEGFVVRWELTGRGPVSTVLGEDPEVTETLAERLRSRLDGTAPFVWTESVRDFTGPPIPDRETLAADDDVVAELLSLTAECRQNSQVRADLRAEAGAVWERVEDPDREDVPTDRLPLTEDRLDQLIDRALKTTLEELAVRRNHVD